jgi:hypothetical protein
VLTILLTPPPKPDFLHVRRDAAPWLHPLRRRLKNAYFHAVDQGWFGLTPLDVHVVMCGFPRSGTTLLQLMVETAVRNAMVFGRERSGLTVARHTWPGRHPVLISKKPDDIFWIDEIRACYRDRQTRPRFVVSVRDPRAVLTSVHVSKPGYCVPSAKWRAVFDHVQYVRQFHDVTLVEYQELVDRPQDVQQRLAAFLGIQVDGRFDRFQSAVPEHFDTRALNGVRPLDPGTVNRWRQPEHQARLRQVLREIPELPERVIEMGYETDTAWTGEYR